jgi:hypothetical protein
MVNVQAKTREEYFGLAGEREPALRELDEIIQKSAPHLEPLLHGGMSGSWLAYGMQPYKTKSMKEVSEWPVIALANQKNYMSLYVMAIEDGDYVAEKYQDALGKVSVGKSCIRFKKLDDLNKEALQVMLAKVDASFVEKGSVYSL